MVYMKGNTRYVTLTAAQFIALTANVLVETINDNDGPELTVAHLTIKGAPVVLFRSYNDEGDLHYFAAVTRCSTSQKAINALIAA